MNEEEDKTERIYEAIKVIKVREEVVLKSEVIQSGEMEEYKEEGVPKWLTPSKLSKYSLFYFLVTRCVYVSLQNTKLHKTPQNNTPPQIYTKFIKIA